MTCARLVVGSALVLLCGCFSEPDTSDPAGSTSDGGSTSEGVGSTGPDSTSGGPDASTGETDAADSTTSSTTAAGSTGTDTEGVIECGCLYEDNIFCEDFEDFGGTFTGWVVPAGSAPIGASEGPCGQAFSGVIAGEDSFAAISRAESGVLGLGVSAITHSGRVRVGTDCGASGPVRFFQSRIDNGGAFASATMLVVGPGGVFEVHQASADQETAVTGISAMQGEWLEFEVRYAGIGAGVVPLMEIRLGDQEVELPREGGLMTQAEFFTVLGPLDLEDSNLGDCTVEFDDVAFSTVTQ